VSVLVFNIYEKVNDYYLDPMYEEMDDF